MYADEFVNDGDEGTSLKTVLRKLKSLCSTFHVCELFCCF